MSNDRVEWEGSEDTQRDPEERRVLYAALDSFYRVTSPMSHMLLVAECTEDEAVSKILLLVDFFSRFTCQYAKVAHYNTTHLRRQSFYALPRAHLDILSASPFSYLETLIAVDDGIDKNAEIAQAILQSGLQSFGINDKTRDWHGKATSHDLEKARSTIRQFYRDWSEEGAAEREKCYRPVLETLRHERESRSGSSMQILIPGAGLGRLVFELCRAGFDAEGNEISYHQLLASSYILNFCTEKKTHSLFPWVHSFSNHQVRSSHLKSVLVPDVHPSSVLDLLEQPGGMSMSASDFLCLYSHEDQRERFDAVATVFFLDTAPNVIRYIETIRDCLKTGGLFINFGPLLWHFENNAPGTQDRDERSEQNKTPQGIADPGSFELADDEVVALVEKLGFNIEKKESGISAPYIQDPESMLQNTYRASYWVARKR